MPNRGKSHSGGFFEGENAGKIPFCRRKKHEKKAGENGVAGAGGYNARHGIVAAIKRPAHINTEAQNKT